MTTSDTTATWSVDVTTALEPATVQHFRDLYRRSFGPLETRAAARHLLSSDEFDEEMADDRIEKYVARASDGRPVGLTTLTRDLDAVLWISAGYYRHRWPDHAATGRLYYLGYTLVDPAEQRSGVFEAMLEQFISRMVTEDAVLAWDMCSANVDAGLAAAIEQMLGGRCTAPPEVVDTQRYFVADFGGGGTR